MNNLLADCLSRLVHDYYSDLKTGGVDCRLVIPAPTESIAKDLQALLFAQGLPSFLVVPHFVEPDEALQWIRAEAVTSVRQRDMVVVVWPGEMSRIQDSVVGAGGAIRNFAFGDEWPWIDDGNAYFRFFGPVGEELLSAWNIAESNVNAYWQILEAAMLDCQASLLRATVFLDQFLCKFDPSCPTEIPDQVGRLLHQLGIPWDGNVVWSDVSAGRRYFDDVRRVTAALVKKVKAVGGGQDLLDRIEEIEPDTAAAARMSNGLRVLIDRFTTSGDGTQGGLLSLYGCWESSAVWQTVTLQVLRQLLNMGAPDEAVVLEVDLATSAGFVAAADRTLVLVENGTVRITGRYSGVSADTTGAELVIRDRGATPYLREPCDSAGQFDVTLTFDELFGTTRAVKKNIKISIVRGVNELAPIRLTAYRCDSACPFVVLFEPFSKVFAARKVNTDNEESEEAELVEVNEANRLYLVAFDSSSPPDAEIDGQKSTLVPLPTNPYVFSLPSLIDPGLDGTGRARLELQQSEYCLVIDFEAKDIVRGEFTLESELIVRLADIGESAARPAVRKLTEIFAGSQATPFSGLGGIDERSRSRIRFAKHFEGEAQGRPLVADLMSNRLVDQVVAGRYVDCCLSELPHALRNQEISPEVSGLLASYLAARSAIKTKLGEGYPYQSPWPIYALMPVFVATKQPETYRLICDYLQAYVRLLEFARSDSKLTWLERFVLTCSDCVVHWNEMSRGQHLVLIGPWHPIVLAKRYMVQSALFKSAVRHAARSDNQKTNVLVRLLDRTNALRWFAVPAADGETYESFYTCASSDPGWLIAFQHKVIGSETYDTFVRVLRQFHGLETSLMRAGADKVARTYLQDFFNAYPTRRAISVLADGSYSTAQLVSSAQSLLFDGETVSNMGRLLPGGIHLGVTSNDKLEELEWRKPVICVYRVDGQNNSTDAFSDIELVSPGRAGTSKDKDRSVPLPRGAGHMAAFTCPLRQVGKLSSGELTSRSFERPAAPSIEVEPMGHLFSEACRYLAELPAEHLVMNWMASIPPDLRRLWTIVPGNHVDPAVFVQYVSKSVADGKNAALWDYSMSLTGALNSYFVLSKIPPSISHELNKSPVLSGKPLAPEVLGELGRVGMALGSESLRSGSKALGVIGVVAAVRLFLPQLPHRSPIRNSGRLRGFLLPVDSFRDILGEALDGTEIGQRQRADLIAVQIGIMGENSVAISCAAIECKYTSTVLDHALVLTAMHQAESTLRRLETLVKVAQQEDGVPERLALTALISFGLRLTQEQSTDNERDQLTVDGEIVQRVLDGQLTLVPSKAGKVVVVTECGGSQAGWAQSEGLVIRVCENHWPGITESEALSVVRSRVAEEFEKVVALVNNSTLPAQGEDSDASESATVEYGDQDVGLFSQDLGAVNDELPLLPQTSKASGVTALSPIMLGCANRQRIYFDPQSVSLPLDNNNIMVTGSSGKGKTQLIKAFTVGLRKQGRNVLLIDFKNDFASDTYFAEGLGISRAHVSFDGLPFNPLIPVPLRKPGSDLLYISISEHINGIVDIFRKTFGLGDQQEAAVKNAIRESFDERGIPSRGTIPYSPTLQFPDFNDVGDKLRTTNANAYNRLDPLFDLGIFRTDARQTRFDTLLDFSSIIDVSQIQNDRIKNAIAKMLVISAHRFYNSRPHSGLLRQFFIFDEAHRVLDTEYLLQFVRECRAYGVGVLLSSQYPSDFPPDISASLNTKVLHGNGPDRDRVKAISKTVGDSLPEEEIADLGMFQAVIDNPQYAPAVVNTLSYPMLLVLRALGSATRQIEGLVVPGLDPSRLDMAYLVELLMKMGLVERTADGYRSLLEV